MEDSARATDLIHEIGAMIVQDPRYAGRSWASISLVTILDGGSRRMSGFYYDADGEPTPENPGNRQIFDKFRELQAVTRNPGGREWKSALVQIKRETMGITIDFEYDDPQRWKVTPSNIDTKPEELRPK